MMLTLPILFILAFAFVFFQSDIWEKMKQEKRKSPIEQRHRDYFNLNG